MVSGELESPCGQDFAYDPGEDEDGDEKTDGLKAEVPAKEKTGYRFYGKEPRRSR